MICLVLWLLGTLSLGDAGGWGILGLQDNEGAYVGTTTYVFSILLAASTKKESNWCVLSLLRCPIIGCGLEGFSRT